MKKILFVLLLSSFFNKSFSQNKLTPLEKQMNDSVCNCLSKLDMNKIKTKKEATDALTNCIIVHSDLIMKLAEEKGVSVTDADAMNNIGIKIGKNLFLEKCEAFTQISLKLAGDDKNDDQNVELTIEGTFKRIDQKGFNYFVLNNGQNTETSFIWLKQFPGSENFMGDVTKYKGKKLKIKYDEIEVYLPIAKGYYKVKEILSVDVL